MGLKLNSKMFRLLYVFIFLFITFESSAKKVQAEIILLTNDTLVGTITGYKNGLISPYSKILVDRKLKLDEIKSVRVLAENTSFKVIKTSIYEDVTYLLVKELEVGKWKGLISFRQCTCNDRYQVTEAVFIEQDQKLQPILKHLFRDVILKKRGDYFGLTPDQKEVMKAYDFKFSSIVEVL